MRTPKRPRTWISIIQNIFIIAPQLPYPSPKGEIIWPFSKTGRTSHNMFYKQWPKEYFTSENIARFLRSLELVENISILDLTVHICTTGEDLDVCVVVHRHTKKIGFLLGFSNKWWLKARTSTNVQDCGWRQEGVWCHEEVEQEGWWKQHAWEADGLGVWSTGNDATAQGQL